MTIPDLDLLARTAYDTGIDPVTYATVHIIEAHIVAYLGNPGRALHGQRARDQGHVLPDSR